MATTPEYEALLAQSGWMQALARRLVSDPNAADDLVQETWLDALRRRPDGDRPLRGWVASVMRNNLGKLRRGEANRQAREHRASHAEELPSTLDVVERASTHQDVVQAVLALEEPYRSTLLMRYFEQLSYDDIAGRTGVTRAAVNSRVTRGLAELRRRLETRYGDRRAFLNALSPLAAGPWGAATTALTTPITIGAKTTMSTMIAAASALAVTVTVGWGTLQLGERSVEPTALLPEPSTAPAVVEASPLLSVPRRAPLSEPALATTADPVRSVLVFPADEVRAAPRGEDEWETRIQHALQLDASIESLSINLSSGDVEVATSTSGSLEIDGIVRAQLDRVDANQLTPHFEDHVRLVEKKGKLKIEDAHRGERGWDVSLVVRIPGELPVAANTGSGDVVVRRHEGPIAANTGSGDVELKVLDRPIGKIALNTGSGDVEIDIAAVGPGGSLVANTGSGDVEARVRGASSQGEVHFNSGSGDVSLSVPAGIVGAFELRSEQGDLSIDPGLDLVIETQEENLLRARNRSGDSGGTYELSTGSGDVELELSEQAAEPN